MIIYKFSKFFLRLIKVIKFQIFKFFKAQYLYLDSSIRITSNYNDISFKHIFININNDPINNFLKKKNSPFIFIDIGAHQGTYTIVASLNKNCESCFAFEPVKETFEFLKKNIEINKITKAILINKAISNSNKNLKIFFDPLFSGKATMREKKNLSRERKKLFKTIEVISSTGLESLIINKKKIKLLVKIDVEGFENIVLNELFKSKFSNKINEIIFEVNPLLINYNKVETFLKEKGFTQFIKLSSDPVCYDVLAKKILE